MKLNQNFRRGAEYNYTVCLEQPLYGEISPSWFVEWVEANVIFGAQKIIVHNHSASASIRPYIEYYVKTGLIDNLPWTFPPGLTGRMHCYLQQTLISDCQYRLRRWSRQVSSLF